MKFRMFLLVSIMVLIGIAPHTVDAQNCGGGSSLTTLKITCQNQSCSDSATVYIPSGPSFMSYTRTISTCCGVSLISYTAAWCFHSGLNLEILKNLRRALSTQDLLVASCDGTYHLFTQIDDESKPFNLQLKNQKLQLPPS